MNRFLKLLFLKLLIFSVVLILMTSSVLAITKNWLNEICLLIFLENYLLCFSKHYQIESINPVFYQCKIKLKTYLISIHDLHLYFQY